MFEGGGRRHHGIREPVFFTHHEPPYPFEEPRDSLYTPRAPRLHCLQRPHEHFIEPHRIGPELVHDLVGIHDVAAGLRHLLVIFPKHNPLMHQFLERLRSTDRPDVVQNLVPKARIEQMQHGMFAAADIEIHRHPVPFQCRIDELPLILRVDKSQVIPAGAGPLRHRVGFTERCRPTDRIGGRQPVGEIRERAFTVPRRFKVVGLRQQYRQLLFWEGNSLAVDPHNRKWLAPVPLAGKQPVPQLIVHGFAALTLPFYPSRDFWNGVSRCQPVDGKASVLRRGINHDPLVGCHEGFVFNLTACDHFADRQAIGFRKGPVALIVRRHSHNGPGSIAHQHVVGNPNG